MSSTTTDFAPSLFTTTDFPTTIFTTDSNFTNATDSLLNSTTNATTFDDPYAFRGYSLPTVVFLATAMATIIVFAVGGNVMVVLTILRHRGMRTRTNMFIVNLAVADILVAVMDMPVSLITVVWGRWVFPDALCNLNAFTMALFLISSIHTLMYISVHKYISITRPFSRAMTPFRIKIMIIASWTWAALCATGPLVGFNSNVYKPGASQCGPRIPQGGRAIAHSLLITISNYAVPLCVMCFCYAGIFREIHSHMQRIRKTSNIDLENTVAQQKKVATTLVLVMACFLFCWTPFILYSNASVVRKGKIAPILNPLAYWCGYFNSACNPIIYAFRSPSFRKGYKEIMCGAQSAKLSAVNSMSFRSRSAKGSIKQDVTVIQKDPDEVPKTDRMRRQRTLLSQTSWRSMPLIPSLVRQFSFNKNLDDDDSTDPADCGGWCRFCLPPATREPEPARKVSGETKRSSGPRFSGTIQEETEEEEAAMKEEEHEV